MIKRINRSILLGIALLLTGSMVAGGLEKGFEAMNKKDYFNAHKQFHKSLFKDYTGANFGLATLHFIDRCPYFDLNLALKRVITADSSFGFEMERNKADLLELGISKYSINTLKNDIADKAYKILQEDPTNERIEQYLKHFSFSKNYAEVTKIKSGRAWAEVRAQDNVETYRRFIIEYPSSDERLVADSLYALRFFQVQTSSGSLDDYKLFVKEFPSSAYSEQALDTIFQHIKKKNTIRDYDDYIRSYPRNKNTAQVWKLMNRIFLTNYTQEKLSYLLEVYPDNPFAKDIDVELKLMYEPRFVVNDVNGYMLIDSKGKRLTSHYYESISDFKEGLARVSLNGKEGFIDKSGSVRIQPIFQDALEFQKNVCVVEKDGKFGLIDRWGEYIMSGSYDEIGNAFNNQVPYQKGQKAGYFPLNNAKEIRIKFEDASDFINGTAIVKSQGSYGAIDTLGNWTIPAIYDWVEENVKGLSRVKKGDLYGLVAHGIGEVLPTQYQAIGSLIDGRRIIAQDGIFGYIDATNKWVIPMKYPYDNSTLKVSNFNSNAAIVTENGSYGIIDKQGAYIVKPKFQNLISGPGNQLAYQEKNRWGYVDLTGNKRAAEFEEAYPFVQGVALVKAGGKYGMIDHTFKYVFKPEYSGIEAMKNTELCIVSKDGKSGLFHRDGGIFLPIEYDKVEMLNIRYFKLLKENIVYIYDSSSEAMVWPK
jgi:hypothetical protein